VSRPALEPTNPPAGTGGPFLGGKARPGRDADHSPHLVARSRMSMSYISSPTCTSTGVLWDCLKFLPPEHEAGVFTTCPRRSVEGITNNSRFICHSQVGIILFNFEYAVRFTRII
jgi:hypothetical protein